MGLLAAGLYGDRVVETSVDGAAAPVHGDVSELGARTEPHSGLFNRSVVGAAVGGLARLSAGVA
jgi:hypothetical protein